MSESSLHVWFLSLFLVQYGCFFSVFLVLQCMSGFINVCLFLVYFWLFSVCLFIQYIPGPLVYIWFFSVCLVQSIWFFSVSGSSVLVWLFSVFSCSSVFIWFFSVCLDIQYMSGYSVHVMFFIVCLFFHCITCSSVYAWFFGVFLLQ